MNKRYTFFINANAKAAWSQAVGIYSKVCAGLLSHRVNRQNAIVLHCEP